MPRILGSQESWPPQCSSGAKRRTKEDRWVYASESWRNWRERETTNAGKIRMGQVLHCVCVYFFFTGMEHKYKVIMMPHMQRKATLMLQRATMILTCFSSAKPFLSLSKFLSFLSQLLFLECLQYFWGKDCVVSVRPSSPCRNQSVAYFYLQLSFDFCQKKV